MIQELSFTESRPDGYDADTRVRFRHRRRSEAGAGTGRSPRVQWADAAKGVCIILVVAWHVVVKDYLQIDWHVGLPVPGLWGTLGEQFLPLRMPLFFTISGIFAANAVQRPWRTVARGRVAGFLYLYAVWLLIHTAVLALVPDFPTDRATSALGLLAQLTVTPSNLWYLYALALYFTLAKATRRLPRLLVGVPAAVLSAVAAAGLLATPGNRAGLYQNLVFFLAGLYLRPWIERWAATATRRRLVLTAGAYAVALAAMAAAGAQRWFGVWPVVSVVAVAFGVTAAARLSRWPALGDRLAALGRITLPIYVVHMPLLALLHRLLSGSLSGLDPVAQSLVVLGYPILLTALVIGLSLAVHRCLLRVHARWLFALPGGRRPAVAG
ncbi:acyltransferase family protein [Micromonospora lupini]|uniref:Putative acyltransferase n=1 Tax=Micromonospora lupini str. Lupac 08 TaxID=1150864 RepID=I0L6C7_9ACTN|nr:acyltransferase family protein [Micromonospora lupini]CCH19374.1 Putative acyltransferase [Micromonospora lupini str. Lupac 08]